MCTFTEIFTTLYAIISTFIPLPEADVCVTFFKLLLCAIYLRLQILSLDIFEEGTLLIIDEIQVYNYQNMTLFKVFLNTMFALLTVPFSNQLIPAMKKYVLKQHYIRASKFTAPYINLNASPNSTQSTEPINTMTAASSIADIANATDIEHITTVKDTKCSITQLEENGNNNVPNTNKFNGPTQDTKFPTIQLEPNDNKNAINKSEPCDSTGGTTSSTINSESNNNPYKTGQTNSTEDTKRLFIHLERSDNKNAPTTSEQNRDYRSWANELPSLYVPGRRLKKSEIHNTPQESNHELINQINEIIELESFEVYERFCSDMRSLWYMIRCIITNYTVSLDTRNQLPRVKKIETLMAMIIVCRKMKMITESYYQHVKPKSTLPSYEDCDTFDTAIQFCILYSKHRNVNKACKKIMMNDSSVPSVTDISEMLSCMETFHFTCREFIVDLLDIRNRRENDTKSIEPEINMLSRIASHYRSIVVRKLCSVHEKHLWACILKDFDVRSIKNEAVRQLTETISSGNHCVETIEVLNKCLA